MSEKRNVKQSTQTVSVTQSATEITKKVEKKEPEKILGVVESCGQLRVREEPSKEANVIGTIPVGTTVELYDKNATNGFYSVHVELEDGSEVDGYCMTDFIRVIYTEEKE